MSKYNNVNCNTCSNQTCQSCCSCNSSNSDSSSCSERDRPIAPIYEDSLTPEQMVIVDRIRNNKVVILTGEAGAGKTTVAKMPLGDNEVEVSIMKQDDNKRIPVELGIPILDSVSGINEGRMSNLSGYAYPQIRMVNAEGLSIEELQSHIDSVGMPIDMPPFIETESTPNGAVIKIGIVGSGRRVMMDAIIRHLTEDRVTEPPVVVLPYDSEGIFQKANLDRLREIGREAQKRPEYPNIEVRSMSDFLRNKR